jgi:hypothetical protein
MWPNNPKCAVSGTPGKFGSALTPFAVGDGVFLPAQQTRHVIADFEIRRCAILRRRRWFRHASLRQFCTAGR